MSPVLLALTGDNASDSQSLTNTDAKNVRTARDIVATDQGATTEPATTTTATIQTISIGDQLTQFIKRHEAGVSIALYILAAIIVLNKIKK